MLQKFTQFMLKKHDSETVLSTAHFLLENLFCGFNPWTIHLMEKQAVRWQYLNKALSVVQDMKFSSECFQNTTWNDT